MCKYIKKWLITNLIAGLMLTGFYTAVLGQTAQAFTINIDSNTPSNSNVEIVDIEVENAIFDPWDGQKAKITFTTDQDAYVTFEILDDDDEEVVTLIDYKFYKKGEYTVFWNGEDESGDIVSQDEYTYKLKVNTNSDQDKETGKLQVKKGYNNDSDETEDPRIKNFYVTKDSFDPGRKEKEYIVFTLTAKADLKVTIYDKKDKKIATLLNEDDKSAGTYKVEWDGSEVIDAEKATYTFQIYAKNAKGEDMEDGKIKVEEDNEDNKTANIYKDTVDQIPYSPKNNNLGISFKLEKDAEVTVEIRDSKHLVATVTKDEEFAEGSHVVYWNGQDKDGEVAEDGAYKYKIIAENNKGKETEEGNFSVEDSTEAKYKAGLCAQFTDVAEDYKYCDAIEWAVGEGVIQGYNNGTFKPSQQVNRAEALKMILKSLKVSIINSNSDPLGFSDTDQYEWYGPYVKTGLALGVIHGYKDGSFKPSNGVNRVEALIMLLNTGKAKDSIIVPTNNIGQPYSDTPNTQDTKWYISYVWFAKAYTLTDNNTYFYPGEKMSRGQMADMLYRYHKNDFDSQN